MNDDRDSVNTDWFEGVAVVGMAGRFPGAGNIDEFWENLRNGVESISFFTDEELEAAGVGSSLLQNPNFVKARAVLDDIDGFDAEFFGYNPREAELMNPQHRVFLECAWEALENAGYNPETYLGLIGVFAGASMNGYLNRIYSNREIRESLNSFQAMIGNEKDHLPTRISYKLNLRGPSLNIQTACSSSLVATSIACQSLMNYQCDMALAGGISIRIPQRTGYLYQEGGINSPDGHCRAFDAAAQGTVSGNGVGIVVLKRLVDAINDGDSISAVIKGSAVNNDGALKVGYTAPSIDGQAVVIAMAQMAADVPPETITYIEAHGTGTPLGDPIEIAALRQVFNFRAPGQGRCAIGSVKTNIGHLDAAAGVAGLIKTVLCLKHKQIPPSLHYQQPNPRIDFENGPFYVNQKLSEWETGGVPRRAGVSSFGIGGTNAHVILEEAPTIPTHDQSRPYQLLTLSAKTITSLENATTNLVDFLKKNSDVTLPDVSYTLQIGRKPLSRRRILVCREKSEAIELLQTLNPLNVYTAIYEGKDRPVIFMFPGQGAQYINMGAELYQCEPEFRKEIDRCSELLKPELEGDLRELLYPRDVRREEAAERIKQTINTQPVLFVIEYALAKLWISWGVRPRAMIGHSIGEYVAATIAEALTLEDALKLVASRSKLMQRLPPGSMLLVPLSEEELEPLLDETLSIAVINGPSLCVISGAPQPVERLGQRLAERGVECRPLQTSHAFHSSMMEPILEEFVDEVRKVTLSAPKIPYISNVTGNWITETETTDPSYWARHLRRPVRFADGTKNLLQDPEAIFLEVGPGRSLSSLIRRHPKKYPTQEALTSMRHSDETKSDVALLLNTLGKLWLAGVEVNWDRFYASEKRRRIPLPSYPFEHRRYWIDPPTEVDANSSDERSNNGIHIDHTPPFISSSAPPMRARSAHVITKQLQLMSEQLDLLRRFRKSVR